VVAGLTAHSEKAVIQPAALEVILELETLQNRRLNQLTLTHCCPTEYQINHN